MSQKGYESERGLFGWPGTPYDYVRSTRGVPWVLSFRLYVRKLRTYSSPDYWRLVAVVHGRRGIPREIARIVTSPRDLTPSEKGSLARADRVSVDFTDKAESPDDALRMASGVGPDVTAELRVPLSSLRRQYLGVSIADLECNPFTRSVVEYLSSSTTTYVGSELQRFHSSWQPKTLADFVGVGLAEDDAESPLARPLVFALLPWDPRVDVTRERDAHEMKYLAKLGPSSHRKHGYEDFGPTSDALGANRYQKYCRVARAIREEGFDDHDHVIDVQLLQGERDWALVVRDGKHRTAALAALGFEEVVVSLPTKYPVVRRSEVETWPGVANGVFRVDQALQVFDRFVAGRASHPCLPRNALDISTVAR